MADESKYKIFWKLTQTEPNAPFADQRGINYHAYPVDEYKIARADVQALANQYIAHINAHDLEAAKAMMDDQCKEMTMPGEPVTKAGIDMTYGMLLNAFPDLNMTIIQVLIDGDMFVINGELHGTSQGQFYDNPPTGRPFVTYMIEIFKIGPNNKFIQRYFWYDAMKIVRAITGTG